VIVRNCQKSLPVRILEQSHPNPHHASLPSSVPPCLVAIFNRLSVSFQCGQLMQMNNVYLASMLPAPPRSPATFAHLTRHLTQTLSLTQSQIGVSCGRPLVFSHDLTIVRVSICMYGWMDGCPIHFLDNHSSDRPPLIICNSNHCKWLT